MPSHRLFSFSVTAVARFCAVAALTCSSLAVPQSPKVNIPDFPGATTQTPATQPPLPATQPPPPPANTPDSGVQPPGTSAPAAVDAKPATEPAVAPSAEPTSQVENSPTAAPPRKLSKAEEKEMRKKEKLAGKKAKEAEDEKNFLKLQGDDIVAPTLDADGNPIHLAPCSKKDKACQKKRKEILNRKKIGMKIENGTLTVDGWTGKARLNYDISEVKFLYVYSPGIGTTIISNQNFPGAKEEKNALKGKTMTVTTADGHSIQLTSDDPLMGNEKKTLSMWVATDPDYNPGSKYPTFGYGSTAKAPYNWPGSRPPNEKEMKMSAKAPPLPKEMVAKEMVLPCVNVRPGEPIKPVKLNGITYTPKPCAKGTPGAMAAGERPPDGSGAASTGVADPAVTKRKQ